jgi:hypothetical protein
MKALFLVALVLVSRMAFADSLPVFALQPSNQTVSPGNTATFTTSFTGATSYQWLFNGTNIPGATGATLQVVNAQSTNCGYYSVIAKNGTGWVPSSMAYLFLDYTAGGTLPAQAGRLPLSNNNNTYFAGQIGYAGFPPPPTNGTVQMVAGPQLDEMQPVGAIVKYKTTHVGSWFDNGYYNAPDQSVPTIAPGQSVYYSVQANFTNDGNPGIAISTVMFLNAGTNGFTAPPAYGLKFPGWPEWPEPWVDNFDGYAISSMNQVKVVGETFSLTNAYTGYNDFGPPYFQWRKNGIHIGSPQNFSPIVGFPEGGNALAILTITNAQPADAGVYDVDVRGNDWFIGQKIFVSIQTTNGQGVFQNSRTSGTNLICDLLGAASRKYKIQQSTNLTSWGDVMTVSNATGTVTFTNSPGTNGAMFYRSVLMP